MRKFVEMYVCYSIALTTERIGLFGIHKDFLQAFIFNMLS